MKCFYHSSDLDGKASGAVVKFFKPNCILYPIDYGEEFPWNEIELRETVYMVDFSLEISDMIRLSEMVNLIWIDHHDTIIKDASDIDFNPKGTRDCEVSACELTWKFLSKDIVPKALNLLGEYDMGRTALSEDILDYQYGIRSYPNNPEDKIWKRIFGDHKIGVATIIERGKVVLSYTRNYNKEYAKLHAFDTTFDGLNALCLNLGFFNSSCLESIWNPDKYEIMLGFVRRSNFWKIYLFTTHEHIHVGNVAAHYGGGGRAKNAGFQCDTLPFKLLKEHSINL